MQYKHWEVNEIALMLYAKFKGYKYSTIGKVLERSPETLHQKYNSIKKNDYLRNTRSGKIIDKALQLEMKIRSGDARDQERAWIVKLKRADGIEASFRDEVSSEQKPLLIDPQLDVPENSVNLVATEVTPHKPLFSFDVNVDEVIRIINAWKGK